MHRGNNVHHLQMTIIYQMFHHSTNIVLSCKDIVTPHDHYITTLIQLTTSMVNEYFSAPPHEQSETIIAHWHTSHVLILCMYTSREKLKSPYQYFSNATDHFNAILPQFVKVRTKFFNVSIML